MADTEMMSCNCMLYDETMTLTMLIKLMRTVLGEIVVQSNYYAGLLQLPL